MHKIPTQLLAGICGLIALTSVSYGEDSFVTCVRPVGEVNYWGTNRGWAPLLKLFSTRSASWVSMTSLATIRGVPACAGLPEGQKQIASKGFTIQKAGYYAVQGLADDRLVIRIRDAFDYPLFTIVAESGDASGTMVSQVVRLTTGDFRLELENSDIGGSASGMIAALTDVDENVIVETGPEGWRGRLAPIQ